MNIIRFYISNMSPVLTWNLTHSTRWVFLLLCLPVMFYLQLDSFNKVSVLVVMFTCYVLSATWLIQQGECSCCYVYLLCFICNLTHSTRWVFLLLCVPVMFYLQLDSFNKVSVLVVMFTCYVLSATWLIQQGECSCCYVYLLCFICNLTHSTRWVFLLLCLPVMFYLQLDSFNKVSVLVVMFTCYVLSATWLIQQGECSCCYVYLLCFICKLDSFNKVSVLVVMFTCYVLSATNGIIIRLTSDCMFYFRLWMNFSQSWRVRKQMLKFFSK